MTEPVQPLPARDAARNDHIARSRVLLAVACLLTTGAALAMWCRGIPAGDRQLAAQLITPGPVARRAPGPARPALGRTATGTTAPGRTTNVRNAAGEQSRPVIRPAGFTQAASPDTAATSAGQAAEAEESWQVVCIGEQRVGWSHSIARTRTVNDQTVIFSESSSRLEVKRFGQKLQMETELALEETADGRLLSFSLEIRNPPNAGTHSEGVVRQVSGSRQEEMVVTTTAAGRSTTTRIPWSDDIRSPGWQDRMIRQPLIRPGQTRTFKAFLPEFAQVATVKITADDERHVELLDGSQRKLLQLRMVQSVLPTLTTRAWLDADGRTLKTANDFLGQPMYTYTVSAEEALKELEGGELDLAVSTLVRVDPIRRPHEARTIVYRLRLPEGNPADSLSDGGTQTVRRIDEHTAELTVTAVRPATARLKTAVAAEYLASSRFLQCQDARVREHARRAAAGTTDPARMAVQLEQYVARKLTGKNFSTALATAAEVAENMEGDCTEHAVLLAAMLRAMRIPSRIAVGLVYVEGRSAFGGHMWTEAWLGERWVPLDATLGQGGIGAGHIRLSHSSFADDAPAPVASFLPLMKLLDGLEIEAVSVNGK